jgi:hypothetical protein
MHQCIFEMAYCGQGKHTRPLLLAIRAFISSKAFCISGVHLNVGVLTPFLGAPVLAVSGDKIWDL